MEFIDKIQNFFDNLDTKKFYIYLASVLGILVVLSSLIIWYYYNRIENLNDRIISINEYRITTQRILGMYEQVKKHRAEVDTILAKDQGFKIGGYFEEVLHHLSLNDKRTTADEYSRVDHNKYEESILKAKLTGMNMRQLAELINTLDNNKRIYIKELDILKSKQMKKAIDVILTIATIIPKSLPTD